MAMGKISKAFGLLFKPKLLSKHLSIKTIDMASSKRNWDLYQSATWIFGDAEKKPVQELFPGIQNTDIVLKEALNSVDSTSLNHIELVVLCSIAKHINAKKILEIGTFQGKTTLNLAVNTPDDTVITTVDLPPIADSESVNKEDVDSQTKALMNNEIGMLFRDTGYDNRIKQVFGDSMKIKWESLGSPFDLIFIDGGHFYECVLSDSGNAFKYARKGGVIIWHDYGMIEDVSKAVDEFLGKHRIYRISGTRLAVSVMK
jgi:hypothetical protein